MGKEVRLVFGVHSHQPLGNFDEVFARALAEAYDPFLEALERHPAVRTVLHYSGCLCEWLDAHAPRHLDRVAALARSGRVEILTGAFYEPILPLIPRTDRVGQIRLQTRYIEDRFGVTSRGMWLAERVWEPTLPVTLREAGVEYTMLDDYHFLSSMDGDPVGGYYITEDQGEPARLFPISEALRYLIPFSDPSATIDWLRSHAAAAPAGEVPVVVIVDDGEKFGHWPGTHAWVHGEAGRTGWLESFFRLLEENASWLRTTTLQQVVGQSEPRGRVYLPPSSYFEMGEWALPPGRGRAFRATVTEAKGKGMWDHERPFLRGGFFRNFQARYSESLLAVRRAQMLSVMMGQQPGEADLARQGRPSAARRELWRAMCNCSYWHGIFGGLYLPHIRRAVGEHLCRARRLFEAGTDESRTRPRATSRFLDIDADGHQEIEMQTDELSLLVEPQRGGALTVLDLRRRDFPLGLTLTRRVEVYHDEMLRPRDPGGSPEHGSIHEVAVGATEEMTQLVVADDRSRASAIDRFIDPDARVGDLERGLHVERGDFFNGRYAATLVSDAAGALLTRVGTAAGRDVSLTKSFRAEARRLELRHTLAPGAGPSSSSSRLELPGARFAVELNLALIESMGRVMLLDGPGAGTTLTLAVAAESAPVTRLRVDDTQAGFSLLLRVEPEACLWHYPVRTVSRSEKGYETIYQGSALLLVWGDGATVPGETCVELEIDYEA